MEKPKTVMLIDDNSPTNFIHKKIVTKVRPNSDIFVFDKAREALLNLKNTDLPPEIIFLDINMPGMDGWDFLNEYEKLAAVKKQTIIIVMLTTSLNPEDEIKAKNYSAINAFENKPLTKEKLENIFSLYFN